MFIKLKKPTSPAMRGVVTTNTHLLSVKKNKKKLHIKAWRGFWRKRTLRKNNNQPSRRFYKLFKNVPYQCNATSTTNLSRITHVNYFKNELETIQGLSFYMKAPSGVTNKHFIPQRKYMKWNKVSHFVGERVNLRDVYTGGLVYSLEVRERRGWSLAESAGTFCKLLWIDYELFYCAINIPSKKFMKVGINNRANLGRVGNKLQKRYSYMSAQKAKTKKQNRISVRGVAMNPVDHPNGGRSNTKQPLKNPWGRPAKKNK